MACRRSRRTYSDLLVKRGISDPYGSGPLGGLEFPRQVLLLEMFCCRGVKELRLGDAWLELFVFCMTCRFRGFGRSEASDADCLQDLGDAEFSREPIAVPYESMAAVRMSRVFVVKSRLSLCCRRVRRMM